MRQSFPITTPSSLALDAAAREAALAVQFGASDPAQIAAAIERLKRQAKKSARALGVPYSQALDAIAACLGVQNWSVLVKNARTVLGHTAVVTHQVRVPVLFLRNAASVRAWEEGRFTAQRVQMIETAQTEGLFEVFDLAGEANAFREGIKFGAGFRTLRAHRHHGVDAVPQPTQYGRGFDDQPYKRAHLPFQVTMLLGSCNRQYSRAQTDADRLAALSDGVPIAHATWEESEAFIRGATHALGHSEGGLVSTTEVEPLLGAWVQSACAPRIPRRKGGWLSKRPAPSRHLGLEIETADGCTGFKTLTLDEPVRWDGESDAQTDAVTFVELRAGADFESVTLDGDDWRDLESGGGLEVVERGFAAGLRLSEAVAAGQAHLA